MKKPAAPPFGKSKGKRAPPPVSGAGPGAGPSAATASQSAPPMPQMGGGSGMPGSPLGFSRGGKVGKGKGARRGR